MERRERRKWRKRLHPVAAGLDGWRGPAQPLAAAASPADCPVGGPHEPDPGQGPGHCRTSSSTTSTTK